MNRSDEPRMTRPIVPEPDNKTVPRHRSSPRRARPAKTRALWLLCLILLAALVSMGIYYWFDRQEWQAKQRELDGQLSNLYARFDSLDDRRQDNGVKTQLGDLTSKQQSLNDRQQDLTAQLQKLQGRTAKADPEAMARRLDTAKQKQDTLSATLDAMGRSLTTLEQSGEKSRGDLDQRLQDLSGTIDGVKDQMQSLAEQGDGKKLSALQERMESVASRIDALETDSEEQNVSIESNQSSLRELRQGQLVLTASMENLEARLE